MRNVKYNVIKSKVEYVFNIQKYFLLDFKYENLCTIEIQFDVFVDVYANIIKTSYELLISLFNISYHLSIILF